ncbi:MAG: hypothetical protein ABIQ30_15000 [Devosia sp.]
MADDDVSNDVPNPWRPGSERRILLGFAAASLLPLVPFVVVWPTMWLAILIFGVAYVAITYFPVLIIYTILAHGGRLDVWWAMGVGAFTTSWPLLVGSVIYLTSPRSATDVLLGLLVVSLFVVLGVAAGATGWLVAFGRTVRYPKQDEAMESGADD